jgi:hypothetical protein
VDYLVVVLGTTERTGVMTVSTGMMTGMVGVVASPDCYSGRPWVRQAIWGAGRGHTEAASQFVI